MNINTLLLVLIMWIVILGNNSLHDRSDASLNAIVQKVDAVCSISTPMMEQILP